MWWHISQITSWRSVTPDATGICVNLCQSSFNSWQVFIWDAMSCRIENLEWKVDPVRIGEESSSHIGMLVNPRAGIPIAYCAKSKTAQTSNLRKLIGWRQRAAEITISPASKFDIPGTPYSYSVLYREVVDWARIAREAEWRQNIPNLANHRNFTSLKWWIK